MKHIYSIILRLLPIFFLGIVIPARAGFSVTYKPVPMESTSSMLPAVSTMDALGWAKPGTWDDPFTDDDEEEGGFGDYNKPQTWVDPYWYLNPNEEVPVGAGWGLISMAACYAVWVWIRKRNNQTCN